MKANRKGRVAVRRIGIIVLGLAIGIPTKEDNKVGMRELSTLVMPFNFAHDKFSEFKYFVDNNGKFEYRNMDRSAEMRKR